MSSRKGGSSNREQRQEPRGWWGVARGGLGPGRSLMWAAWGLRSGPWDLSCAACGTSRQRLRGPVPGALAANGGSGLPPTGRSRLSAKDPQGARQRAWLHPVWAGTLLWASPAVPLPRPTSCFLCSWAHACGVTPVLPCCCLSLRLGRSNTRSSAQSPNGLGFLGPERAPGTGVHHSLNSHNFLEGRVLLLPFCR